MNKKNRGQRGLILSRYNRPTNHITLEPTHVCSGTLKKTFTVEHTKLVKTSKLKEKRPML
jgi:hypothetical protein